MATMKALGPDNASSRDFCGALKDVAEAISLHAASMTTEVSASYLEFAIQGVASSAVHSLIECLLDSGDERGSLSAAGALTEVGHSSGWDCLFGTLLGMHLCLALHADRRVVEGLELSRLQARP